MQSPEPFDLNHFVSIGLIVTVGLPQVPLQFQPQVQSPPLKMLAKLDLPVAAHSTIFGSEESWGEIPDGR